MVVVLHPTSRKAVEQPEPSILDRNWPCFAVAFTMASVKLLLAYIEIDDWRIFGVGEINVFFLMELGSTPLAILNPRVWFAIFMCSLAYMSVETGYPSIAIASVCSLLVVVYGLEYFEYRYFKNERRRAENVYQVVPLVDKSKMNEMQAV